MRAKGRGICAEERCLRAEEREIRTKGKFRAEQNEMRAEGSGLCAKERCLRAEERNMPSPRKTKNPSGKSGREVYSLLT